MAALHDAHDADVTNLQAEVDSGCGGRGQAHPECVQQEAEGPHEEVRNEAAAACVVNALSDSRHLMAEGSHSIPPLHSPRPSRVSSDDTWGCDYATGATAAGTTVALGAFAACPR